MKQKINKMKKCIGERKLKLLSVSGTIQNQACSSKIQYYTGSDSKIEEKDDKEFNFKKMTHA